MWTLCDAEYSPGEMSLVSRIYHQGVENHPRLFLGIYDYTPLGRPGLHVTCSTKKVTGGIWEDCPIPRELIPQLIEMLQEALVKLDKS